MNSLRSPLIFIFKSLFYLMSPKWGSHHNGIIGMFLQKKSKIYV